MHNTLMFAAFWLGHLPSALHCRQWRVRGRNSTRRRCGSAIALHSGRKARYNSHSMAVLQLQQPLLRATVPGGSRPAGVCPVRRCRQQHVARAVGKGPGDGQRPAEDLLLSPAVCPVPKDQQPIHELQELQDMFLFDWATIPGTDFARKLAFTWAAFFTTMGLPISLFTFSIQKEPLQCLVSASAGSMFIVTVLVWRLYLGWQHVGDRLISATVEYEETGWYDGQVWVKTPEVIMRDRLQCNYTVKPALARLKRTLLGLGGALAASVVLLACLPPPQVSSAPANYYIPPSSSTSSASYEQSVQQYEPWGMEEGEDAEADSSSSFDMRSHMLGSGEFVQYNQ